MLHPLGGAVLIMNCPLLYTLYYAFCSMCGGWFDQGEGGLWNSWPAEGFHPLKGRRGLFPRGGYPSKGEFITPKGGGRG